MSDPGLPLGFQYAGVATGVKSVAGTDDMALIFSDREATIAGVYTQNLMAAAPVAFCRGRTPMARGRVVVVNSGNANSCTGQQGAVDAEAMAQAAAQSWPPAITGETPSRIRPPARSTQRVPPVQRPGGSWSK